MEWVASTLHTTSERGVSSITTADVHSSLASSRLNWRPRRFKWTRPFCWKTKSGFCACAITFQTQNTRRCSPGNAAFVWLPYLMGLRFESWIFWQVFSNFSKLIQANGEVELISGYDWFPPRTFQFSQQLYHLTLVRTDFFRFVVSCTFSIDKMK
jgi:hypothetical protein